MGTKASKSKAKGSPTPPPPPPPPPQTPPPPPPPPFTRFPKAKSGKLPKPSKFFSSNLLNSPLPTTSLFTNFVTGKGDQPSFVHPYLIKLSCSSLSVSYPSISSTSSSISQDFTSDLTISTPKSSPHSISSFSDLTVSVDFLSSDFQFLLAKGSPYVTLKVSKNLLLVLTTETSGFKSIIRCSNKKHKIKLKNNQTWIVYTSSELSLIKVDNLHINSSDTFSGVVRIAVIPEDNSARCEEILDSYHTCYAISGEVTISTPFSMEYNWGTNGWDDKLLMLAHPLHLKLLSVYYSGIEVLDHFKYKSIDGNLVGVIGKKWKLRVDNIRISWDSKRGIPEKNLTEIRKAVLKDVNALSSPDIPTTSDVYHYAMQISRAARLALIAEEVNRPKVSAKSIDYLKKTIEPWLEGTFDNNKFLYDDLWKGVVSKQGLTDVNADHGFGLYNNHLSTLGHFVFSIAVVAKHDPEWRKRYKGQAYELVGSYMSMKRYKYTKLRCFDMYKLHSWTKHLGDNKPRNSENPSASIHAYYAASLLGKVYDDDYLVTVGSTLASFEIEAVKTWWHVKEGGVYEGDFLKMNKMVTMNWEWRREAKLSYDATAENKECRLGIQVLPLMPELSDILFSDVNFVREVVNWAKPALTNKEATDDWKAHVYALQAICDNNNPSTKIGTLNISSVEGNSVSNMLWWACSNVERKNCCLWCRKEAKDGWYCAYCR